VPAGSTPVSRLVRAAAVVEEDAGEHVLLRHRRGQAPRVAGMRLSGIAPSPSDDEDADRAAGRLPSRPSSAPSRSCATR
jgi:hypothetical protein